MPFTKGQSGNPYGRPVGPRGELNDAFIAAIKSVEKDTKKNLLKHFVRRALADDSVLIAVMRKLLPDLKSLDAFLNVVEDRMSSEEAELVRIALKRSMENVKQELTEEKSETKKVSKKK